MLDAQGSASSERRVVLICEGEGNLINLEGKTWTIRRVTHRKRYRGGRFELYAKIADVTEVSRAAQEESNPVDFPPLEL